MSELPGIGRSEAAVGERKRTSGESGRREDKLAFKRAGTGGKRRRRRIRPLVSFNQLWGVRERPLVMEQLSQVAISGRVWGGRRARGGHTGQEG